MKNNLKTFPDSMEFEPILEGEGDFDNAGYLLAISKWHKDLKTELRKKLEEIGKLDPNPVSYYSGQRQIIKAILGDE